MYAEFQCPHVKGLGGGTADGMEVDFGHTRIGQKQCIFVMFMCNIS